MAVENRHALAVAELQLAQPGLIGDTGLAVHIDAALDRNKSGRRR